MVTNSDACHGVTTNATDENRDNFLTCCQNAQVGSLPYWLRMVARLLQTSDVLDVNVIYPCSDVALITVKPVHV